MPARPNGNIQRRNTCKPVRNKNIQARHTLFPRIAEGNEAETPHLFRGIGDGIDRIAHRPVFHRENSLRIKYLVLRHVLI